LPAPREADASDIRRGNIAGVRQVVDAEKGLSLGERLKAAE
jgi:hypothetical protein